ncbi:MAG: PTS sugar transporter subunit IIA [Acetobacteraceae bacterium]
MTLSELLAPERVVADLVVLDKRALLVELGRRAGALLRVPGETITAALQNREEMGSTGLGQGFALPHARIKGLNWFFGMFVRLARPIAFDAIDEQPVSLVFLLLSPEEAGGEHLTALATISRRMSDPSVVRLLVHASSAARLFDALAGDGEGKRMASSR